MPVKLRQLDTDGYRVVFFTNQAGIEKGRVQPDTIRTKIEAIVAELGIPVLVSFLFLGVVAPATKVPKRATRQPL